MFDLYGNLTAGFHKWTLAELEARLVTAFPGSMTRMIVMGGYKALRARMVALGIVGEHWVDGSFSTAKADPGDIDLLTVADKQLVDNLKPPDAAAFQLLVSDKATKALFNCDSYFLPTVPQTHPHYEPLRQRRKYWYGEFSLDRNDRPKGIVTLNLP